MHQLSSRVRGALTVILAVLIAVPALSAEVTQRSATELPTKEVRVSFAELGSGAIALQGVQSAAALNFGTRVDQLVVGGVLHLRMTYSPSLIEQLSHLEVSLNGQSIAAIPLSKADAGHETERTLTLDPRFFSDYNRLSLNLIAHYTTDCEDPAHSSLWVKVSPESYLTFTVRSLELRNDLALLPAPFFDAHDNRHLVLPIVLPGKPSRELVRSAGVAASWFGVLADYRGARFPVSFDVPPAQHALVFATNNSVPSGLPLAKVDSPTVSMIDNPSDPSLKLLVFQGKDEAQLRQAVEGIVIGSAVLTGSTATIDKVRIVPRSPYDAPRWLRSDHPVTLGELIENPDQLQGRGIAPAPMLLNLRLPPDLFMWNRPGVPLTVHYRYTAPADRDNSLLAVSVNNQLLRSYRLQPDSESSTHLLAPFMQGDGSRQTRELSIPRFQLGSDNQLVFQFSMDFHREAACKEVFIDNTRESIDPDSTIDISGFPHYTALPNLALFANAGFPFTRNADLAKTTVVLADTSDKASLEELFFLLGRMGRQSGAVALAYRLQGIEEADNAQDADLLILSGGASSDLVKRWNANAPLQLGSGERSYRQLTSEMRGVAEPSRQIPGPSSAASGVQVGAEGALAAFLSFESPVTRGRTVVALLATDPEAENSLVAALDDNSRAPLILGQLSVIRGGTVQSFAPKKLYYVGSLSWSQWLWFHFSHHALLLISLCLAAAIAVGLLIYGTLQRRVSARLEGSAGN